MKPSASFLITCLTFVMLAPAAQAIGNIRLTTKAPKPLDDSSAYRLDSDLSYTMATDLAEAKDLHTYIHSLKGTTQLTVLESARPRAPELYHLGLEVEGHWKSYDTSVDAQHDVVELSDVEILAGKRWNLGTAIGGRHQLGLEAGSAFPTSADSQYEGVNAVPFASAELSSQSGIFTMVNALTGMYVANTYEYSPVSKEINPDWSGIYGLSFSLRLSRYFSVAVGGSVKYGHHIDDTALVSFANFQRIAVSVGSLSVGIQHKNGSHTDDHEASLWYYDRYRQIISLFLKYGF